MKKADVIWSVVAIALAMATPVNATNDDFPEGEPESCQGPWNDFESTSQYNEYSHGCDVATGQQGPGGRDVCLDWYHVVRYWDYTQLGVHYNYTENDYFWLSCSVVPGP